MEFTWGVKADHRACLAIAAASPEHFHPDALARIWTDIGTGPVYVARAGDAVRAFAVVQRERSQVAEILWVAVDRPLRQRGVGTELFRHLAAELHAAGTSLLVAKTLAPTSQDAAYVATRRFYERAGFLLVDTVDPYPGWKPGNPCAIYAKPLGVARDGRDAGGAPPGALASGATTQQFQTRSVLVSPPTS